MGSLRLQSFQQWCVLLLVPFAYRFVVQDIKVFTESDIFFNIFRVIKLPIGKMICNFSNSLFILLSSYLKNQVAALGSINVYFFTANMRLYPT
jgi:hypothetical protein